MTRTLIYIGASQLQVPGIRWAKEVGLRVIVTDPNPNAPGIALADGHERIDGTDGDALLALARGIEAKTSLAGAYCGSDFGLPAVARIGAELGVPACTPGAVDLSLRKEAAVQVLRDAGIAVPLGRLVGRVADLKSVARDIGFPLIVKPTDSSGSRGVRTVAGEEALHAAYAEARRFSDQVLVEHVVEGHHIDINGVCVDGHFHRGGLFDRYFTPPPLNIPLWGHQPTTLADAQVERAYDAFEAAVRALGITDGPCKADAIWTEKGPVMLEIAPRFHGDVSTSFVTPLATGGSTVKAWFAHLAGQRLEDYLPGAATRIAGWMAVFPNGPGIFREIEGVEAAKHLEGIADIAVLKAPGYRVGGVTDNLAVLAFIWGEAESLETLHEVMENARKSLRVRMA